VYPDLFWLSGVK